MHTGAVEFRLSGPSGRPYALEVFDVRGRRVARVTQGVIGTEAVSGNWSQADDSGRRVPAGAYWLRASLGEQQLVRRLLLLR